ncbi:inositol phospholipid synthesis and fat-storage-inducing TM-domain-containing protein [Zychaea mexicana]|uniref:inositol phospholipid synthesis and fat-storage-inducing TM-domain-containing protein n=1 Tax=Zychaea mexicana TaxID=64656 RepID=UPI0022FEC971|nr:inositol phospholipid synthesis and fat-storage-inducing TM-domain-containing protein [Zychaea mexicana]KAI9495196.1 inositol phospholipid synthesis and fat-storage-inducing TM-domain-containing protein [Zychaea mexicana]
MPLPTDSNNSPLLARLNAFITHSLQPHQKFAVSFYILTVFMSYLYSLLGRAPVSYFTNKRNLFNVLFVKLGWFWTTVVYMLFLYFVQSRKQSYERGLARYVMISAYWYIMTQWLLGPSFIERVFVATGGQCTGGTGGDMLLSVYQQAACKRAGGKWGGGHDVSGHCVLLILSSLFLWEEAIAWAFYSIPTVQRIRQQNGWPWLSVKAVFGLLILWWWMLIVTSVYFHGHFELVSGCFFGVLGWAIVYVGILPRLPQIGFPPLQL